MSNGRSVRNKNAVIQLRAVVVGLRINRSCILFLSWFNKVVTFEHGDSIQSRWQLPLIVEVVGSPILISQILGVFPHITFNDGIVVLANWIVMHWKSKRFAVVLGDCEQARPNYQNFTFGTANLMLTA